MASASPRQLRREEEGRSFSPGASFSERSSLPTILLACRIDFTFGRTTFHLERRSFRGSLQSPQSTVTLPPPTIFQPDGWSCVCRQVVLSLVMYELVIEDLNDDPDISRHCGVRKQPCSQSTLPHRRQLFRTHSRSPHVATLIPHLCFWFRPC